MHEDRWRSMDIQCQIEQTKFGCIVAHCFREQVQTLMLEIVESMMTRWKNYEMVAAPVHGHEGRDKKSALFSRTPSQSVNPSECSLWAFKARIEELEPEAAELQQLRAHIRHMQDLYGEPNCFFANTAFRKPDGTFNMVQDSEVGEEVRVANGQIARVTHVTRLQPRTMQDLVDLVTNQATLRVSANHRIVTNLGQRKAGGTRSGPDRVVVGGIFILLRWLLGNVSIKSRSLCSRGRGQKGRIRSHSVMK
jgi:hypothetical protein